MARGLIKAQKAQGDMQAVQMQYTDQLNITLKYPKLDQNGEVIRGKLNLNLFCWHPAVRLNVG